MQGKWPYQLFGAVLAAVFLLSTIDISGGPYFHLIRKIFDGGHVVAFAVIYLLCGGIWLDRVRFVRIVRSTLLTALIIVLIEVVQPIFGRSFSLMDISRGLVGLALSAMGMELWLERRALSWPRFVSACYVTLILISLAWAFYPAVREVETLRYRSSVFPLLGDFSEPIEMRLWSSTKSKISRAFVARGQELESVLKVETLPGQFSGVDYRAGLSDWSSYRTLSCSVLNPGGEFELHFRIDDERKAPGYAERFNKTMIISSGLTDISIPIAEIERTSGGTPLNTKTISRLIIFVAPSPAKHEFYLDKVRLD